MTKNELKRLEKRDKEYGISQLFVIYGEVIICILPLFIYEEKLGTIPFVLLEMIERVIGLRSCNFVIKHNSKSRLSKESELSSLKKCVFEIIEKKGE